MTALYEGTLFLMMSRCRYENCPSVIFILRIARNHNFIPEALNLCQVIDLYQVKTYSYSVHEYWNRDSQLSFEPQHDKTNKMTCVPREDSDQPGHPPRMIRVFAVRMKKPWVFSFPSSAQRRLWSNWADCRCWLESSLCAQVIFFFFFFFFFLLCYAHFGLL